MVTLVSVVRSGPGPLPDGVRDLTAPSHHRHYDAERATFREKSSLRDSLFTDESFSLRFFLMTAADGARMKTCCVEGPLPWTSELRSVRGRGALKNRVPDPVPPPGIGFRTLSPGGDGIAFHVGLVL